MVDGGDGLSDCDAHGTWVASLIAAEQADGTFTAAAAARKRAAPDPGAHHRSAASRRRHRRRRRRDHRQVPAPAPPPPPPPEPAPAAYHGEADGPAGASRRSTEVKLAPPRCQEARRRRRLVAGGTGDLHVRPTEHRCDHPAMMAVTSPASAPAPDETPNASASGSATIPTVMPARRSPRQVRRTPR